MVTASPMREVEDLLDEGFWEASLNPPSETMSFASTEDKTSGFNKSSRSFVNLS